MEGLKVQFLCLSFVIHHGSWVTSTFLQKNFVGKKQFVFLCAFAKTQGLTFCRFFLDNFISRINFSHISSTSWIYKSYEIVLSIWNITSTRNIIFCNLVQCMADNSCHISIITTNIMLIALVVDICVVESFLLS